MSGASGFPDNIQEDISPVAKKNGSEYNKYYFNDFYKQLKSRFLKSWGRKRRIILGSMAIVTALATILILNPSIFSEEDVIFIKKNMRRANYWFNKANKQNANYQTVNSARQANYQLQQSVQ